MVGVLIYKIDFDKFTPKMLDEYKMQDFTVLYDGKNSKTYKDCDCFIGAKGQWMFSDDVNNFNGYSELEFIEKLNEKLEKRYNKGQNPYIIFDNKKLKGIKTAVWGKKSHRDDMIRYLENSARRMF